VESLPDTFLKSMELQADEDKEAGLWLAKKLSH